MQMSIFSSEEHPVRRSASRDFGRDLLILEATSPSRFLECLSSIAPSGWFGRTSPVSCQTNQGRLVPSSGAWQNSGMGSPTAFLTLSTSEFHNDAVVSSLSDILETGVMPQRFFLSAKACRGILRRAEKRGKTLPPALLEALTRVATMESEVEAIGTR